MTGDAFSVERIIFYLLAGVSVLSGVLVITRRNPVMSALFLILNFFCLAALYLTLHAQFIAVIQILVYAGAVMVLFLFVIMLLNLGDEQQLAGKLTWRTAAAVALAVGVALQLIYILGYAPSSLPAGSRERAMEIGTVEYVGGALFTKFLFPFEVTSLLLLAAIVGAVILAKKKLDDA